MLEIPQNTEWDTTYGCFAPIPRRIPPPIENIENAFKKISRTQSNHVILLRNCKNSKIVILQNQRMAMVAMVNCRDCELQILDSAVVCSRTLRVVDCEGCVVVIEDADVRKIECFRTVKTSIKCVSSPTIVSNLRVIWREGCKANQVHVVVRPDTTGRDLKIESVDILDVPPSSAETGGLQYVTYFDLMECPRNLVLRNEKGEPSLEGMARVADLEKFLLQVLPVDKEEFPNADEILQNLKNMEVTPFTLSDEYLGKAYADERREVEEPDHEMQAKVKLVAKLMVGAKHCVVYTGAGISTSANIPDFRGPQGVWTLRDQGNAAVNKAKKLNEAEPTYAHYAITELVRRGLVKFIISTNMDSLHIRSGLPKHLIIEQHGNCHKEVCTNCGLDYWRSYETTSTVINTRDHFTLRNCTWCGGKLRDTIVHFSENYSEQHTQAISLHHARECDLAIVMGTSMNVQPNATYVDQCLQGRNRGKIVLVNLQKTPYDNIASVRIFAKTDKFMASLMGELGVRSFDVAHDCKEEWDEMKEEDLVRYYQAAYIGFKKKEGGLWGWMGMVFLAPAVVGLTLLGLERMGWIGRLGKK